MSDAPRPLVVLLHALGLSGRSWDGVVDALGDGYDCLALDLPGYGDNAGSGLLTVEQTADWVAARVRERAPDRWLLVGHSMGGKIATVLARWTEDGERGVVAPDGVVLVDPSPPSPEPMSEERRDAMAAWAANGPVSREHAEEFIGANAPGDVLPHLHDAAVEDVQRTSRTAWLEWLRRGSLEDWSDAVGVLRTPASFVESAESGDLGAATQRQVGLPHWREAAIHEVDGAHHFVVLEQPEAVAQRIAEHWAAVRDRRVLPPAFERLIGSGRVSAKTRRVMLARLDPPAQADAFSDAQRTTLRALVARILPQRGTRLDLAGLLEVELAAGRGDGWRFAALPPDLEAWRAGLDTVAAAVPGFADLPPEQQDEHIGRLSSGDPGDADGDLPGDLPGDLHRDDDRAGLLDGGRMALWLQDVRAEAVRVWLSHPGAMAWLRFDGFADGGDGERKQGYLLTHAGEHEAWQRDWRTGEEWS